MADSLPSGAAADMADTGQWKLEAVISRYGVQAQLRAIGRPGVPVRTLLDVDWKEDEEGLLQRIENAVYDHPQILDDYSARIIIDTPLNVWAPSDPLQHPEESAGLYVSVYGGKAEDVMTEEGADDRPASLYTLVPGLKAFLGRTFPGAIIRSFQSALLSEITRLLPEESGVMTVVRPHATDIAAFRKGALLAIASRPPMSAPDIVYHTLNTLSTLGLSPTDDKVWIAGDLDKADEVTTTIGRFCPTTVRLTGKDIPDLPLY